MGCRFSFGNHGLKMQNENSGRIPLYRYVGPRHIAERVSTSNSGTPIRSPADVACWVRSTGQELSSNSVTVTFIIDREGSLLIADRRSEHVACAGGNSVRSAGEMTFSVGHIIEVVEISNQSTGYCPEPESWPEVAAALSAAGLVAPSGFTLECLFRRCTGCGDISLVKDNHFKCPACSGDLSRDYNVQLTR